MSSEQKKANEKADGDEHGNKRRDESGEEKSLYRIVFACFAAVLIFFPAVLVKPGWPAGLKADEPAYFLMAMSLAHDGDLLVETEDLRRLFDQYPHAPSNNMILASDDGWETIYFGKPYIYSLFAAPAARLLGASGIVAFNMSLLLLMIWMGTRYLERYNSPGVALLFSSGFFLLSAGFAYVFWIHPELFNMTSICACLFLGLSAPEPAKTASFARRLVARPALWAAASGAVLAFAVYNKPMLAAMGVPPLVVLVLRRRFPEITAWLTGAVVGLGLIIAGSFALTGHGSAYLGFARGGYKVCSADALPVLPGGESRAVETRKLLSQGEDPAEIDQLLSDDQADEVVPPPLPAASSTASSAAEVEEAPPARSWMWIFRVPPFHLPEVIESFRDFLIGRHTGLFVYFPFTLLCGLLFLRYERRSLERWSLVLALFTVAIFFLLWIPFNWHGGGGFVGNRYFVNAYPGFLFLVTRIAPRWLPVMGYFLGGLLLGPILFSPTGRSVPWPTLQAHVRNAPYPLLPLELSIQGIPGYHDVRNAGVRLTGRKDVFLPRGRRFWIHGATSSELWLRSLEEIEDLVVRVESPAVPNTVTLELGDASETLLFAAPGERHTITLRPGEPTRELSRHGGIVYAYRLDIESLTGSVQAWTQNYPPRQCLEFPYSPTSEESFYVGAEISFLGSTERLERDVWSAEWGSVRVPRRVRSGETFTVETKVKNTSEAIWPTDSSARVSLSYHWEMENGETVVRGGPRTFLEKDVPPGVKVHSEQEIIAPEEPGTYVLALDLVYDEVAWFSRRGVEPLRKTVEVLEEKKALEKKKTRTP